MTANTNGAMMQNTMTGGGMATPHNSITDFFVYQMAMGKSDELTIHGITKIMVLTNMGEIKQLSSRFFTWLQTQCINVMTLKFMLFWTFLCSKLTRRSFKKMKKQSNNQIANAKSGLSSKMEEDTRSKLNINLNVVKNKVKSQGDLLALVNYLLKNKLYLSHIEIINRLASDKYSSIEEHIMNYPIKFTISDDIEVVFYEHLKTTVEISLHDPESIKLQNVEIIDRDGNDFTKLEKVVITGNKSLRKSKFFELLSRKYKDLSISKIFEIVAKSSSSTGYIEQDTTIFGPKSKTLFYYWSNVFENFFTKQEIQFLTLWMLMKSGADGLNDLFMLPFDANKSINLFGVNISIEKDKLLSKEVDEYQKFLEVMDFDYLNSNLENYISSLKKAQFGKDNSTADVSHDTKKLFSELESVIRDDINSANETNNNSMTFLSEKYEPNDLYNKCQYFLNKIRIEYYKFIKLPQAFKEVKVFTIKIAYTDQMITKLNPEWEKWKAEKDAKMESKEKENSKSDGEKDEKNNNSDKSENNEKEGEDGNNANNANNANSETNKTSENKKDEKKKDEKHKKKRKKKMNARRLMGMGMGHMGMAGGMGGGIPRGMGMDFDSDFSDDEYSGFGYFNGLNSFQSQEPQKEIVMIKKVPELEVKQVGQTYKPIEYLYMSNKDKKQLQAILSNFTTNSELYQKLGIQHKLCLELYGEPGCGKSTAIRSIASYLQRNIYYLDLNGIIANSHLQMVFDYLQTNCGGGGVVVMEDIDCMTDIVLRRTSENGENNVVTNLSEHKKQEEIKNEEKLTLSYLLNLLDGTISIEDLVVIMTTNHPDKLDPALTRPGRVDAKLEFKKCDRKMLITIFESMFEKEMDPKLAERIIENKFTPADVIFSFLPKLYQLDESDESILEQFIEPENLQVVDDYNFKKKS